MSQEKLSILVILPIEKKILVELEYKNIIGSNLKSQKPRKIFFFKIKKYQNINIIQLIYKNKRMPTINCHIIAKMC